MGTEAPFDVVRLDRRRFLIGSAGLAVAAVAGGQAAWAAGTPGALGAYVQLLPDGRIIIVTPGAEMGQGIANSLPKIIAEEMDADWSRVEVRLSGADPAFQSPVNKRQRSANSDGITSYYEAMRTVGATTRALLVAAAAARWGVDPATVEARDSRLTHRPTGRTLAFGEVAEAAAALPAPSAVALKDPASFRLIGKDLPRKDIPAKVRGTALFGMDVDLPGMLRATVRHSPVAGAKLLPVDPAPAMAVPGVVAVVPIDDEAIGVIARSYWAATRGAEALVLEAAPGPRLGSDDIRQRLRGALDASDGVLPFPVDYTPPSSFDMGATPAEIDAAIAGAAHRFEVDYEVPFLAHAALEPLCGTALLTADACEMWLPSQAADVIPPLIAGIVGLPATAIKINRTHLGGGFGRKNERDFTRQVAILAKAVPGRPVMLIWPRDEDMRNDYYRPAFIARTRAGVAADGRILAMSSRIAGQPMTSGAAFRVKGMADGSVAGGLVPRTYRIDRRRIEAVEIEAPVKAGFWRSVSGSQNGFFSESMIDEIALKLGRDPLAYRLEILRDDPRGTAVLEAVGKRAKWGTPLARGRGRGVAYSAEWGTRCALVTEVSVTGRRLRVERITCAVDPGLAIDPDNVIAQIEGGLLFGLSAALAGEITLKDGAIEQSSFADYPVVLMAGTPPLDVFLVPSTARPGGVGEAGVPGVAPALCTAIHAATGERIRRLPIAANNFEVI
ncbi:molybdopterin cofactor-binding domain-containing protein [Polymorphobacter sp.]|uniref:xanthine dehydrogenase family protein molybdopterin-binding subunit n=1 Tax=Polymorphobacter sp. TaxID=1909290 RepID=UPI003F717B57